MAIRYDRYDEFYEQYRPFVSSYVARRVSPDNLDDLVAEVFATTWRRRADVPADALPWLYRTARNLIGNRYRSIARLTALQDKVRAIPREASGDPADVAGERDALLGALAELDDHDRELLLLVAWEGLTTQEIAMVMEISPGTASVRIHRARERLNRAIQAHTRAESES